MSYKFANDVTVKNLDMFHKIMEYKHKIGVGDRFWKQTADKLNELGKGLDRNKSLENFDGNKKEKVDEIKELLEGIQKRFDRGNQKFKYGSDVLKPFLKKEKRIRELMENIMDLLNKKKRIENRDRKKLFKNKDLALKNGLREAYDNAININKSINTEKTEEGIKLDIFKKKLEVLFLLYKNCFKEEFPEKELLKKADNLIKFCENLKEANKKIKTKVNEKINSEENKVSLLEIYKFIELYKNLIDNITNSIKKNSINTKNINIDVLQKKITNGSNTAPAAESDSGAGEEAKEEAQGTEAEEEVDIEAGTSTLASAP